MDLTEGQKRYKKYLDSEDWKKKRALKNPKRCGICASTNNLNVHHLNYRNWTDVKPSDLRVLCNRCHALCHELMNGGQIVFKNDNHLSQWAILKHAVKKELGLGLTNCFYKKQGY